MLSDGRKNPKKKMIGGKKVYHTTGVPAPRRTTEEKIEIAKKVCDYYATGDFTVEALCKKLHLSAYAFRAWAADSVDVVGKLSRNEPIPDKCIPEIHLMWKEAKRIHGQSFELTLKDKVHHSIMKKVAGYEYNEVKNKSVIDTDIYNKDGTPNTNFGKMKVVETTVTTKHMAPSDTMLIFVATNVDGERFKDRRLAGAGAGVGIGEGSDILQGLTQDQLEQKRRELQLRISRTSAEDIEFTETRE